MSDKLFKAGVVIAGLGASAVDSQGAGWVIAGIMVLAGMGLAFAGYTSDRLEEERREAERRTIPFRKAG